MALFKKACEILEFDKILEMLANFTSCEETKVVARKITPNSNLKYAEKMAFETDEALVILTRFESPNFLDIKNPKEALKRAAAGIFMNTAAIFNIGNILKQARCLDVFSRKYGENLNYLNAYFDNLFLNKNLEELIFKSLISPEEVADDASFELRQIRSAIKQKKTKIRNMLEEFVKGDKKKYLQENIVTLRQGRHVLAVKAEYVKEVSGLIHDVSSSGATIFLEPSSVVAADNELKKLYKKEEDEIAKILKNLSKNCLEFAQEINRSYFNVIKLDLIFAKAKLAIFMKANKPDFVDSGEISLKKVKHPLIDPEVVVPIDIELGGHFKNLVITGPNTGGKTVALKTVGLVTVMAMCGMLIPAEKSSQVSVFNGILIAIGDEQSIENSLSTFSAHMKNIVFILRVVNSRSLVLIDELASGTDPEQGAALAVAIVEKICKKKATLAATTHYTQLKTFAFKNKYVKNACFEFNLKSLEPTYKLLMGVAGQSNAFEISKKIGVGEKLIKRAKTFMTKKGLYLNNMLTNLEIYRKEYKKRFLMLKEKFLKLKKLSLEIKKEKENLNATVESKIKKAKQQANRIIEQTRMEANLILAELKEIKAKKNKMETSSLISRTKSIIKKSIYGLLDSVSEDEIEIVKQNNLENFEVGDVVLICDLEKKGKVASSVDANKKVLIEIGNIKTRVEISRLKLLNKKTNSKNNVQISKRLVGKRNRKISTEIDLRGLDSQEALVVLDRFIDECVLNNLGLVTIIHGKGTGVLKNAVTKHLKNHPNILSKRFGVYGEGEDGVTIVELK